MNNKLIATIVAYSMYFTQGFFFVLPGALTPVLNGYFGYSLSTIGYCFAMTTLARTLGNYYTGKCYEKIKVSKFIYQTVLLVAVTLLIAFFTKNLWIFTLAITLAALALGAHFSVSNNIILIMYNGLERTSQMSFLNFFYSAGAIIGPLVVGFFLINKVYWGWVYLLCIGLTLVSLLYYKVDKQAVAPLISKTETEFKLNLYSKLSSLALFLNVKAEIFFSVWLPVFLLEKFAATTEQAAFSLVFLWVGVAVGRFACGFLAKRILTHKLIYLLGMIICLSVVMLFTILNMNNAYLLIFFLGLGFSGMYSTILSYGNEQAAYPSVKLMTIITTSGAVGAIVGLFLSSLLKEFFTAEIVLLVAALISFSSTACIVMSEYQKCKHNC